MFESVYKNRAIWVIFTLIFQILTLCLLLGLAAGDQTVKSASWESSDDVSNFILPVPNAQEIQETNNNGLNSDGDMETYQYAPQHEYIGYVHPEEHQIEPLEGSVDNEDMETAGTFLWPSRRYYGRRRWFPRRRYRYYGGYRPRW